MAKRTTALLQGPVTCAVIDLPLTGNHEDSDLYSIIVLGTLHLKGFRGYALPCLPLPGLEPERCYMEAASVSCRNNLVQPTPHVGPVPLRGPLALAIVNFIY